MLDIISISFTLMLTDHMGVCQTCNFLHPRIEIGSEITEQLDAAAGVYYNSKRRISPFVGVRWNGDPVFAEVGILGGYTRHAAVPYGRLGVTLTDDYGVFIFPILHGDQVRLGLGFEVRF